MQILETLYEVNYYYKSSESPILKDITVSSIQVYRRGILPGCSRETIYAKNFKGKYFQGCPDNYFTSELEAWESAQKLLLALQESKVKQIETLTEEFVALSKIITGVTDTIGIKLCSTSSPPPPHI